LVAGSCNSHDPALIGAIEARQAQGRSQPHDCSSRGPASSQGRAAGVGGSVFVLCFLDCRLVGFVLGWSIYLLGLTRFARCLRMGGARGIGLWRWLELARRPPRTSTIGINVVLLTRSWRVVSGTPQPGVLERSAEFRPERWSPRRVAQSGIHSFATATPVCRSGSLDQLISKMLEAITRENTLSVTSRDTGLCLRRRSPAPLLLDAPARH